MEHIFSGIKSSWAALLPCMLNKHVSEGSVCMSVLWQLENMFTGIGLLTIVSSKSV